MICQSCGMPIELEIDLGRYEDGTLNHDYCAYCFQDGKFTPECTMERMVEICIPMVAERNPDMSEDEVRKMLMEFLPTLKRWKKD